MNTNASQLATLDSSPELIKLRAEIDAMFDELAREFRIKFEHAKLKCIMNTPRRQPKSHKVNRTL